MVSMTVPLYPRPREVPTYAVEILDTNSAASCHLPRAVKLLESCPARNALASEDRQPAARIDRGRAAPAFEATMSQEEEYEEDFAAKYDGVFAGEADGDDDESEGDEEDYGDEFEGAEPAMPDPRAEDGSMGSGRPGAADDGSMGSGRPGAAVGRDRGGEAPTDAYGRPMSRQSPPGTSSSTSPTWLQLRYRFSQRTMFGWSPSPCSSSYSCRSTCTIRVQLVRCSRRSDSLHAHCRPPARSVATYTHAVIPSPSFCCRMYLSSNAPPASSHAAPRRRPGL